MITEFIEYLNGAIAPSVEHAWTSDPVEMLNDNTLDVPSVFVYPGDFDADPSGIDNAVRQRLQQTVFCVLVCRIENYEAERDAMFSAILGWTFNDDYDAFELQGGEFLELKSGVLVIRDSYITQYLISEGD